eukprot:Transcript_9681.p1 GENE.Transcript_9681~~Transcript_9681.p1  ORF type:complete len:434 (-),score=180.71 Transcript_9681:61-1362(-)
MSEPSALSNLHYYQILGLRRTDVTQDEVKRAYKRLSLKFHPDRNRDDPNTTAKFQEISTAYNVLSSPRKRQIYDAYGEQGLKMYDSYMSFADSDDDSSKMPLQPVTMLLMVCVGISVLIFMSAAFGMLLLLYLSGSISPPLAVVFLPLWLVAAGGLCCLSVSLVGSRTNQTNLAVATLQLLCAVAFLILLCVRADSDQHLAYTWVFSPLFLLEATNTLQAIMRCRKEAHEAEVAIGRTTHSYALHMMRVLGWAGARLATALLLPIRLDGGLASASWSLVLLPLWLLVLLEVCLGCCGLQKREAEGEREVLLRQMSIARLVVTFLLGTLLLLLCLRLDGHMASWLWIMLPLFVASGLYFCCCSCLCCTLWLAPKPSARDVPAAPAGADLPTPADTARSEHGRQKQAEQAPLLATEKGRGGYGLGGTRSPPDQEV